jgi:hypothetical protein
MCNQQGKNETQKVKLGQHCIVAVSLVTPVLVKKLQRLPCMKTKNTTALLYYTLFK